MFSIFLKYSRQDLMNGIFSCWAYIIISMESIFFLAITAAKNSFHSHHVMFWLKFIHIFLNWRGSYKTITIIYIYIYQFVRERYRIKLKKLIKWKFELVNNIFDDIYQNIILQKITLWLFPFQIKLSKSNVLQLLSFC